MWRHLLGWLMFVIVVSGPFVFVWSRGLDRRTIMESLKRIENHLKEIRKKLDEG